MKFYLTLLLVSLGFGSLSRAEETHYISPNLLTVAGGGFADADAGISPDLDIGFTFDFGGLGYSKVRMSLNGILFFSGGDLEYVNVDLSGRTNRPGVYVLWDDLAMGDGNDETLSRALYLTSGAVGSRVFIMQWGNWHIWDEPNEVGTFNVVLYEGSNKIQIYYRNMFGASAVHQYGESATIGIVASSSYYSQYSINSPTATEGKLLTYTPAPGGNSPYTLTEQTVTPATAAAIQTYYLSSTTAPQTPVRLSAAPDLGVSSATLTWDLSAAGQTPTAYKIRSADNAEMTGFTETAPFTSVGRNYLLTGLIPGTTYYWQVISTIGSLSSPSTTSPFTQASNTVPVVTAASVATAQDAPFSGLLTATDADNTPSTSGLVYVVVTPPTSGAVVINNSATGAYTYTPATGFSGSDSFAFKAFDGTAYSASATMAVAVRSSTTTITSSLNPSQHGQTVTFTATVTSSSGTPNGMVTFKDGDTELANATLDLSGQATLDVSDLSVGDHTISIVYAGNSGFGPSSGSMTQTVNKASASVSLSDLNQTYSGTARIASASTTPPGLAVDVTYDGSATPPTNAGNYAVVATIMDANYSGSSTDTLAVAKSTLLVTADPQTRLYGAANPTLTASYSGFVNGEDSGGLTGQPALSTAANNLSPVGDYAITAAQGTLSAANYAFAFVDGTLAITPQALTIIGDNASRLYGVANPAFTASYSGFVNGEDSTVLGGTLTVTSSAEDGSPIGSYGIVPAGLTSANYAISFGNGTLTVNPAALTVTADNQSRGYGVANPALTGTLTGIVNSDNLTASYTTVATVASPVGDYKISPLFSDPDGKLGNYLVTTNLGTLTVTPAALTITANNQSRAYGQPNPTLTVSYSGFVNGDTAASLTTLPSLTTSATVTSLLGGYSIVPSGAASGNYTISYVNGTLTVTKAPLLVLGDAATRPYGQANPVFTAVITGVMNGDDITASFSTTANLLSPPAEYTIALLINDPAGKLGQYNLTLNSGILTVTPGLLVGTVTSVSRSYGQANPGFTLIYSGFMNSDDTNVLSGLLAFSCLDTNGAATDTNSPVGIYPIEVVSGQSTSNYAVQYVPGTMTVTKAELIVTADNASRVYGDINPALTGNLVGIQNNENISATFASAATPASNIGNYDISPAISDPDGKLSNYSVTTNLGTLSVTPAALLVTVANQSRPYGQANPTLTGSVVGILNGDDLGVDYTSVAGLSSPVGDYPIIPVFGDPNGKLANYSVTTNAGTLAITPQTLSITGDNASRLYGIANPAFTASFSGFVNGEDSTALGGALTVTSSADIGSPIGNYAIVPAGLTSANYAISFVNGTLTVNPAALTVTADNQSRGYGVANPALTGTLTGIVNSDNLTASYTTVALTTSPVGAYEISPLFSDPDGKLGNYLVTTNLGTLTVTPAALTITANNQSRAYGQPNPTLTVSYSGFVNGDSEASLTVPPSLVTSATVTSLLGGYPIVPSGAASGNYTISYVNGTLTVTKAPLLVLGDAATRPYGQANPVFTAVITGVMNGDDITASFSTDATLTSLPGRYDILTSLNDPAGKLGQYDLTLSGAQLTVIRATLIGTVQNQTRGYGQDNAPFTVNYSGFANGQDSSILAGSLTYSCLTGLGGAVNSSSPVGNYAISVVSGQTADNYVVQYVNGTLSVTPVLLTVKGDNATRIYGTANLALTASISGFVNSEDASVLGGTLVVNTAATAASPVGSYPVTPSGLTSANYSIAYVDGALSITPAALAGKVNDVLRGYGDTNPVFTISYSGFVNGDDSSVLGGPQTFSCVDSNAVAVEANTLVGVYPIQVVVGQTASNYNIAFADGTLTVTQAVLTVVAADQSRLYGAANPTFTAITSGYKNGEDAGALGGELTLACAAETNSPVGTYAIKPSGLTSDNYAITFTDGILTVGKVTVTATADNQTRVYGAANPTLTLNYSGFINGEDASVLDSLPTISTLAAANSPVGSYAITLTGGSDGNYNIALIDGSLLVSKATVVATANAQAKLYGAANPPLAISYSGFANGEAASVLDVAPVAATPANAGSPIGSYPINLLAGSDDNYEISLVNGILTVGKAELTVTANDASRKFGLTNPTFTGDIVGILNGDAITASYSSAVTLSSAAGTYPIVPTLVDPSGLASNYNVALINGTLTITADDPPVIVLTAGPGFYVIGQDAILVDTNALVTDGGSPDFAGGILTISIASNGSASDLIALKSKGTGPGEINLIGNAVASGTIVFGTLTGGNGTNAIVTALNSNATPAIVEAMLRCMTFSTTETNTDSRLIQMVLTDGDGGTSAPAFRTLTLNRPPVANDDAISASEGVAAFIALSDLLGNDTDADGDTLALADFSAVSANGGRITSTPTGLIYRAPAGFTGEDLFAYLVADGRGGEAVGILALKVVPLNRLLLDLSNVNAPGPNAGANIQMGGVPGGSYRFETSSDLNSWTLLGNATASPAGVLGINDPEAKDHPIRFYRAIAQ